MAVFQAAELLIPRRELLENWAVIACDQFTSQPDYWREVREQVMEKPSAYHIVFPEAELCGKRDARIASINETMHRYLDEDVFESYPDAYVFVKRTLQDGSARRGVVGVIDLEQYDFASDAQTPVRATEQTVVERIPPRVRIRSGAALETSHVMLLMDDAEGAVLDSLEESREELPAIYSFELMQGGGHIEGRLVSGAAAEALSAAVARYEAQTAARFAQTGKAPLFYAVGDGNHSLAAAKTCWETLKAQRPELAGTHHPARYAMVELQNIRDESQKFEPIHRLLIDVPVDRLLEKITSICAPGGTPVDWQAGERQGMIILNTASGALPVAVLQPFLDAFLKEQGGAIDYIHGEETAAQLAGQKKAISFLMPNISKEDFFRGIVMDGVLPRKTFSMGHAQEKRYYLECRKITD
ncbi:MAG: DUF1015 domain-containing protein [Oscillospiraceae bacterium]|nr:DUF1015 domain-containing protein [Oscillospiraceae bacterium]